MEISLLVKVLIGVAYGLFLSIVCFPISKKLILSRTEDPAEAALLGNTLVKIFVYILSILSSVGIMLTASDAVLAVRNLLLLVPMFSIAVVDSLIRKIPNPLLLVMIVIQLSYVAYVCITNHSTEMLITSLFGFFIGFVACTLPSLLRIPVGAGDIKYSGVIGLCIYMAGYFQAMLIMGIIVLAFLIILKIKKRGGMKTQIPMGPFLSAGTVITMCFPLLDSLVANVSMF
ncbi:MAG: prepilin peptidase [Eubacterium sp.]